MLLTQNTRRPSARQRHKPSSSRSNGPSFISTSPTNLRPSRLARYQKETSLGNGGGAPWRRCEGPKKLLLAARHGIRFLAGITLSGDGRCKDRHPYRGRIMALRLRSVRRFFQAWLTPGPRSKIRKVRPALELLEDRIAMATFGAPTMTWAAIGPAPVVGNTSDGGTVSGRVTAVATNPGDATGSTVFIGTAGGGVWQGAISIPTPPAGRP